MVRNGRNITIIVVNPGFEFAPYLVGFLECSELLSSNIGNHHLITAKKPTTMNITSAINHPKYKNPRKTENANNVLVPIAIDIDDATVKMLGSF